MWVYCLSTAAAIVVDELVQHWRQCAGIGEHRIERLRVVLPFWTDRGRSGSVEQ
jgi:hypothetical protein